MRKNLWTGLFLFLLCSKIYFLFGFHVGTHLPAAPVWMVALRDAGLGIFLGFFLWQAWNDPQATQTAFRQMPFRRAVILIFILGLAIYGFHLWGEKSLRIATQHYLRNILVPMLLFPIGWLIYHQGRGFPNLRWGLKAFALINVLASYPQFFFPEYMWVNRPTGLLGDPLLNTAFILIGLWIFFRDRHIQKPVITYGAILFSLPIIYAANSLSSLFAFITASAVVFALAFRSESRKALLFKKSLLVATSALVACLMIFLALSFFMPPPPTNEVAHGVTEKAELLYNSLFCWKNCGPKEWFLEGRVLSNLFPLELFSEKPLAALAGNWQYADYYRLDSLWASLAANWGLPFLTMYLLIFFVFPLRRIFQIQKPNPPQQLVFFLFFFYWAFSILNAGMYKYPLNIVFYLSLVLLWAQPETPTNRSDIKSR